MPDLAGLPNYTSLCDQADTHYAHVELWAGKGNRELQTLRVTTPKRSHCTPIIDYDIEEAAVRILNKNIFR